MTESPNTKENISKSLENPILEVVKTEDISSAIASTPQKNKLLPNQIPLSLDKFENALSKEREQE